MVAAGATAGLLLNPPKEAALQTGGGWAESMTIGGAKPQIKAANGVFFPL